MTDIATADNQGFTDSTSLSVLLNILAEDLPQESKELLNKEKLRGETLSFLDNISLIENSDYLSSVAPTPSTSGSRSIEEKTLVQDIAELEAKQRTIETNLKNLTISSQKLIVQNRLDLDESYRLFNNDFKAAFSTLRSILNEDDLNEIKDQQDQDLHDLELDLDQSKKSESLSSAVSNAKKIQSAEKQEDENLSIVLNNMDQIQNILELPSLTGACIKGGHYSEALEISSYTRRLAIRFPESDLIEEVENGIKNEMDMMLTGLIRLLRTNLKQSSIIKILSYLRRIQPFNQAENTDEQLKRIYLHARYQFIKLELSSLSPLRDSNLNEKHCKRSIEVIREFCFGAIVTYRNIFPNIDDLEYGKVEIELEEEEEAIKEEAKKEEIEEIHTEEAPIENTNQTGGDNDASEKITHNDKEEAIETNGNKTTEEAEASDKSTTYEQKSNGESAIDEIGDAAVDASTELSKETEATDENVANDKTEATNEKDSTTETVQSIPLLICNQENRKPSNLLLFEFVKHVVQELALVLQTSLPLVHEKSVKHGLYLQLVYCTQSLARIDESFSDLMVATLLNAKDSDDNRFIIDRKSWISSLKKQVLLTKSLEN